MASTYSPDTNLDSVSAKDIETNALDSRHVGLLDVNDTKMAIPVIIQYEVTADATGGLYIYNAVAPYKLKIIDIIIRAKATSGSGSVRIYNGSNAISNAITMATDTAITRAGTIDDTYSTIAVGGSLKVVTNGANDRGMVSIIAIKIG